VLTTFVILVGAPAQAQMERASENEAAEVLDRGLYQAATGEVFAYTKQIRDGREVVLYKRGGKVLDQQQMGLYESSGAVPKIEPALAAAAAEAEPGEQLPVMVWLADRRGVAIARGIRAERMPEIDELGERVRAIRQTLRPGPSLDEAEERAFVEAASGGALSEAQSAELRVLAEEIEAAGGRMREEIARQVTATVGPGQRALAATIEVLGGAVTGHILSQNALTATVPANRIRQLAARREVARVSAVPEGYLELDNQGGSLGLPTGFWANGYDGGIWDAGILDTGVQQNHPNLDHVTYYAAPGMPTTDADGHGTGVAGIIYNDHATNRGMAPGLDAVLVGSCSDGGSPYTVFVHADWMVSTAADDPEAINLSCGYGTADDVDYSAFDQFWDGLIDDNYLLVGKSTGNGGDGTTTITHPAPAYNLLAVANIYDQNTVARSDDVIRSTSSRGPTLGGRKKPDIAAPGHNTLTTNNDWSGVNPDFTNLGGTSAAAPHVTGGVVLLTEMRGDDNPIASKAALLNAADAWTDGGTSGSTGDDGQVAGSEWNKTYGWGYLDLWEAWFNGLDVFTSTVDDGMTPPGPDFKLFTGYMFADEKATLVWNRHVGYSGTAFPSMVETLTDLDVYAYRVSDGGFVSGSASTINNVEQIAVPVGADYVLKVDVFGGIDPDVGIESFALATEENFVAATPPTFSFNAPLLMAPPGQQVDWDVSVVNNGSLTAFDNDADIAPVGGFSVVSGPDPQPIGDIPAGGNGVASWRLAAPCTSGSVLHGIANASVSYGESLSSSQSLAMNVGTTGLSDDVPVVSSQISHTFDVGIVNYDWTAVAVNPGAVDRDVYGDTDPCIGSPYQASTYGGTTRDFVVADGRDYGNSTHYAMISYGSGGTPYTIEADQAFDVGVGGSTGFGFTAGEVVETFEIPLQAGTTYRVGVDMVSGATDIALFGFEAARTDGDRGNPTFSADSFGAGGGEARTFTAGSSGLAGVVVINDNASSGESRFFLETFSGPVCDGVPAVLANEVISSLLVLEDCDPFELAPSLRVNGSLTVRSGTSIRINDGFEAVTGLFAGVIDPALNP
jgi:serine protease AprX